jgi:type II secretory pathway predicted ATPase ExeA
VLKTSHTRADQDMRRPSGLIADVPKPTVPLAKADLPASYLDLYGLSKPPFGDPSQGAGYILFGSHRRSFELLIDHMVNGSGLVMLFGDAGVGKTEMLRAAGDVAGESGVRTIQVIRPPNGRMDLANLTTTLLGRADQNPPATDIIQAVLTPPRKVLLVDDLDLLPPDCLLLLLQLLRASADKGGVAIVATSTMDIGVDPARVEFAELVRLARKSVRLPHISPAEARQYIERSLWISGGTTRRLIASDALKLVVARSDGLPGLINRQMEAAFTAGFARGENHISAKTIAATAGATGRPHDGRRSSRAALIMPALAMSFLAIGVAAFLYRALFDPQEASETPTRAVAQLPPPSPAAVPRPEPAPPPAPARPAETLSPEVMAALMKRGEQSLALGDIAAARLLFQRAAEAGNARAALAMGKTYDPNYLPIGSAQGEKPDPVRAATWYRRAATLGEAQAADLLQRIKGS